MTSPRLTIVFDNYAGRSGLRTLWGFAALLELGGRTLLFDTGSNGRVLLANMAALGHAPSAIDMIFLSHPHWDHIGGLDSVLELNPGATVVVHAGFSRHLIADLRTLCGEVVMVDATPLPLAPGLLSTGLMDSEPPEHALILATDDRTVAISGCAHPGMERIVARAAERLGRKIDWAIGGFHLMNADEDAIARSIRSLQDLGIDHVVPTHCTGDRAKAAFRRAYGAHCHEGGVGRTIELQAGG
ncbi:metal-dependent hydrolase, beta-lactamase superfamily II [Thioflavicoccus mobilis 8321]|uniref:Metal-dependent hydrolase, beta-lactamase superfamily II n=1 Tax=Thioflavicoccus mobilis 8321 TaxID=765912 RepID=L0GZR7_9GAMM|nr:MBL fold metallo-hydrolase [Thioflavicoccus mobilis]AGA92253.1 metal-dependent hydrolase, beta-lactamase superfamily II [Thioflavicoccus mobilis 8321]